MMVKDSHCSFCGNRFGDGVPWPRRCPNCRNSTYRNPLPVAVVLLPMAGGIVVIRRNTEPRKGTLALPGGYIDFGDTWQAGPRGIHTPLTYQVLAGTVIRYLTLHSFANM